MRIFWKRIQFSSFVRPIMKLIRHFEALLKWFILKKQSIHIISLIKMRMNIYMSLHCHITDGQWTFKHISAQEIIGLLLLCNKSFTEHIFNKNLDFFFQKRTMHRTLNLWVYYFLQLRQRLIKVCTVKLKDGKMVINDRINDCRWHILVWKDTWHYEKYWENTLIIVQFVFLFWGDWEKKNESQKMLNLAN